MTQATALKNVATIMFALNLVITKMFVSDSFGTVFSEKTDS